jgi:hypothetical protein
MSEALEVRDLMVERGNPAVIEVSYTPYIKPPGGKWERYVKGLK